MEGSRRSLMPGGRGGAARAAGLRGWGAARAATVRGRDVDISYSLVISYSFVISDSLCLVITYRSR